MNVADEGVVKNKSMFGEDIDNIMVYLIYDSWSICRKLQSELQYLNIIKLYFYE